MFEFVDTFNREIQLDDLGPLRRLMPVMITHGKHTGKTGKIAGMWQKYVRIVEETTHRSRYIFYYFPFKNILPCFIVARP